MSSPETLSRVAPSPHVVQLFDPGDSLAAAVCTFVRDGLWAGEVVWLVMSPAHWADVTRRARAQGLDLDGARQSGRLVVQDATETINLFMRGGRPDAQRFAELIAAPVRNAAAGGTGLRVYGEMVDLLAGAGDFRSAQQLEGFWNQLRAEFPFTLFCGYSAEHFGSIAAAGALREICRLHTHVQTDSADVLSRYLLNASQP